MDSLCVVRLSCDDMGRLSIRNRAGSLVLLYLNAAKVRRGEITSSSGLRAFAPSGPRSSDHSNVTLGCTQFDTKLLRCCSIERDRLQYNWEQYREATSFHRRLLYIGDSETMTIFTVSFSFFLFFFAYYLKHGVVRFDVRLTAASSRVQGSARSFLLDTTRLVTTRDRVKSARKVVASSIALVSFLFSLKVFGPMIRDCFTLRQASRVPTRNSTGFSGTDIDSSTHGKNGNRTRGTRWAR